MKKLLLVICFALCLAGVISLVFAALPECVDHGQTCVIGGTPCCNATDTCSGKFPNTICQ